MIRQMFATEKGRNIIAVFAAALLGGMTFFLLYSETLNPRYDAWLLRPQEPDPMQQYLGWVMYRYSPWTFPLGVASNLAYPVGLPITYTDSLPLLAIPAKLVRGILPHTFQYFGFWILACFVLQALFGCLLVLSRTKRRIFAVMSSALFLLSPIFLFRIGGHFALGGQWLILAALWLLLRPHQKLAAWAWLTLAGVSLLVHPYLLFMVGLICLTDLVSLCLVQRSVSWKKGLTFFVWLLAGVAALAFALGLFAIGSAAETGFGDFSMNGNALLNPLGWSAVLPDLPILEHQMEGFNYAGLGVLGVLLFVLILGLRRRLKFELSRTWPVLALGSILTIVALSHRITWNDFELVKLPLPSGLAENVFGVIRSSGRFFWPVLYLLLTGSLYVLARVRRPVAFTLLGLALILQLADIRPTLAARGQVFENQKWENSITTPRWMELARVYQHIVFIPVIHQRNYPDFVLYAAAQGKTINDGYFARPLPKLKELVEETTRQASQGVYQPDTIYVISRSMELFIEHLDFDKHLLVNIDDTLILFPDYKISHPERDYQDVEFSRERVYKLMGQEPNDVLTPKP